MSHSLQDKIILITGASSGIGAATARILAGQKAKLILAARRFERLETLAKELTTDCHIQTLDVSNKSCIEDFFHTLPKKWQAIDILINNAGLALTTDPFQEADLNNWDIVIDTNIKGLLYTTRHVLPGMIARKFGHIVNLGSIAGQQCYPNGNVYVATKHAVRAISNSLRLDLFGTPIRVTEIAPGAVHTEFSTVRWNDADKARDFYKDFDPLLAEDIADAILYCLTRPLHVDITEMTIMPTDQAAAGMIHRTTKASL